MHANHGDFRRSERPRHGTLPRQRARCFPAGCGCLSNPSLPEHCWPPEPGRRRHRRQQFHGSGVPSDYATSVACPDPMLELAPAVTITPTLHASQFRTAEPRRHFHATGRLCHRHVDRQAGLDIRPSAAAMVYLTCPSYCTREAAQSARDTRLFFITLRTPKDAALGGAPAQAATGHGRDQCRRAASLSLYLQDLKPF